MKKDLYLDANATSPILPAALAAAVAAMQDCYGNPSSSHATGLRAKAVLDDVRDRARRVLGAASGRLQFTSGATEGIQVAVLSALCAVRARHAAGDTCGDLLLYGATEHKAVPESLAHWNRLLGTGLTLRALPVDADGRHRLDVLRELAPRAAMVCTMAANNETGAVSDLDGIAAVLRECAPDALWMVDCVQALGKLPLTLADTRIDYAPFSGHKLYAPKGIGMLYVREGAPYTPLMAGGGQEGGQRAGTENMAGIAALGAVLAALEDGTTFRSHEDLACMRARVADALRGAFPGIVFNAPLASTLPTTLNVAVPGLSSKALLDLFDAAGLRVSAGSACSAAKAAPSYVLEAMGVPLWQSSGAVRLSFGPLADDALIDAACAAIRRCGDAARATSLAALAASGLADGGVGIAQFSADGRHGWLLFDHGARDCIAIDPAPALVEDMAGAIRAHGLCLRAALGTDAYPEGAAARAALRGALGLASNEAGPFGWPAGDASGIVLGGERLARLDLGAGRHACYTLAALDTENKPRIAFVGDLSTLMADDGTVARDVGTALAGALLCHGVDVGGLACTRLGGVRHAAVRSSQLAPDALAAFLDAHADALLLDVREAGETMVGAVRLHGRDAVGVPLSRLAEHLDGLLATLERPLVFVCRSGNRSARAAHCLRQLGHPHAYTLVGGVALAA